MALTSTRRSALADQVIAQLRNQITTGEWPVGSRIPTEPELVEQLGVARNTVREAVRALAHNGLLDIRQGSGTYVVATSELAGVMQRRFADADPRHVGELRSTLESSAARLAALRRTDRDLRQLDLLMARREEAWGSGDAEAFVAADATLHLAVVAASHNDVLTELYADLNDLLRDYLREDVGSKLGPTELMDHARLVEAIRAGDAETAAAEARPMPWTACASGSEAARSRGHRVADPGRVDLFPAAVLDLDRAARLHRDRGAVGVDVPPARALGVEPDEIGGGIRIVAVGDHPGSLDRRTAFGARWLRLRLHEGRCRSAPRPVGRTHGDRGEEPRDDGHPCEQSPGSATCGAHSDLLPTAA